MDVQEGSFVEVTAGPCSGQRGNVIKVTGSGGDRRFRIQLESGGTTTWATSVASVGEGGAPRKASEPSMPSRPQGFISPLMAAVTGQPVTPPATPTDPSQVQEGAFVEIVGGTAAGQRGTVIKVTGQGMEKRFRVQIQGGEATTWATSVAVVGGTTSRKVSAPAALPPTPSRPPPGMVSPLMAALTGQTVTAQAPADAAQGNDQEGAFVEITSGPNTGQRGTVMKVTGQANEKRYRIAIENSEATTWTTGIKILTEDDRKVKTAAEVEAEKQSKITDFYDIEKKKLGSGAYGSVRKCTNKVTGLVRAMKTIPKPMVKNVDMIWKEVAFMKRLDHPNIIKVYDTFEDHRNVYLIMELCSGGELFDRIVEAGNFTEIQAAVVLQHGLRALYYMHAKRIVHRDLKPENFLLTSKEPIGKAGIKLIDFGLAHDFPEPGKWLRTRTGSAYYVAPQVLNGEYDEMADLWSFGVIAYVLLCGYPPFAGETDPEIFAKVKKGEFTFDGDEWKGVSEDAKEFIRGLLTYDPKKRTNAENATRHIWIEQKAPKAQAGRRASVVDNLRSFRMQGKLKKAALHVIANQLSESQIKGLKDTFMALDENGDGLLTVQELKNGMSKVGLTEMPADLQDIIEHVDSNCSGSIDYTEFVSATLDKKMYIQEDVCWAAFRVFDKSGTGRITKDDIAVVLANGDVKNVAGTDITDMISAFDRNGDGELDFEEFMYMMRGGESVPATATA